MLKVSKTKLNELFEAISAKQALYLPVDRNDGAAEYKKYESGMTMSKALNTVRSAKDFFFPQTENLVDFKMEGKNIEVIDVREESEDFVIFGVRACDARSFTILDKVFLADPVDSYYKNRRDHGTVVTMACTRPSETCFCQTFGIDPTVPEGDAACFDDGENIFFIANNDKGQAFIDSIASLLEEGDAAKLCEVQEKARAIMDKLPLAKLSTENFGGR